MNMYLPPDMAAKMNAAMSVQPLHGKPISHWLSGDAAFSALKKAVDELTSTAPKDYDIVIQAFDLTVRKVRFIKPHIFLFSGVTDEGHDASVVCHFTQLVARVVFFPKRGPSRVITGFAQNDDV